MFGQRSLQQFVAVAEELNFRRAAQRLHMTQPPLTQGIQRLEAQLGVRLFDRSRARVALTPAGAALLDGARRLLAQTDSVIETARRAEQGVTGLLRVAFVPSVGLHLLPDVVRSFRERHPGVHLELAAQTSGQQFDALRRGTCDVGIVVSPADLAAHEEFDFELLCRAEMCVAVPAGHRLARRRRVALRDLAHEPFVMLSAVQGPAFLGTVYAACSKAGFMPRVVQEASPIQAVLAMVACGVGVSLVPDAVRAAGHQTVSFLSLSDRPRLDYALSAVWLRERESVLLRRFVAAARGMAGGRASE